ncbi:MAG: sigma-70 family RNA polymerase sigma factor [Muribaculaceae bacterium]|nr:sigma-70 family RNA polymerase sigma factor [Muribaculaceae bacterium]
MDNDFIISAFRAVRRRLRRSSGDDEEDALQEAFCRLWVRRGDVSSLSEAEGFLTVTSRRIILDGLRRKQAHPETDLEGIEAGPPADDEEDVQARFNEIQRLIDKSLSPRDREILGRRDRDGWEFDEIAEYFKISEANARVIVSRARKTIRDLYRKRNDI